MFPSSFSYPTRVTKPTQQKNTKSFTGKVGLRQDVTKTSLSCPSKSDSVMLP